MRKAKWLVVAVLLWACPQVWAQQNVYIPEQTRINGSYLHSVAVSGHVPEYLKMVMTDEETANVGPMLVEFEARRQDLIDHYNKVNVKDQVTFAQALFHQRLTELTDLYYARIKAAISAESQTYLDQRIAYVQTHGKKSMVSVAHKMKPALMPASYHSIHAQYMSGLPDCQPQFYYDSTDNIAATLNNPGSIIDTTVVEGDTVVNDWRCGYATHRGTVVNNVDGYNGSNTGQYMATAYMSVSSVVTEPLTNHNIDTGSGGNTPTVFCESLNQNVFASGQVVWDWEIASTLIQDSNGPPSPNKPPDGTYWYSAFVVCSARTTPADWQPQSYHSLTRQHYVAGASLGSRLRGLTPWIFPARLLEMFRSSTGLYMLAPGWPYNGTIPYDCSRWDAGFPGIVSGSESLPWWNPF